MTLESGSTAPDFTLPDQEGEAVSLADFRGQTVAAVPWCRQLDWDGCFNVRDLGDLPTAEGRATRWGAVVRADALDGLSEVGWPGVDRVRNPHGHRPARTSDERARRTCHATDVVAR